MPQEFNLKVNGRVHNVSVEPDTPLLYALRNDLGLKGAKFGCGLEQCGACTIIIDGEAVPSCRIPIRSVQGCEITTIEGIGTSENLHPIQEAIIEEQAIQCGFCTPGIIMAAKALLDRNPNPSEAEIKSELAMNLCRCGVYDRLIRAVKRAAGQFVAPPAYRDELDRKLDLQAGATFPDETDGLAGSLMQAPDIDSWVKINSDGTVTILTGKVELGQDLKTSIAMIAAEELEVSIDRIRIVMGDTAQTPNEGYTVGSMSLESSGNAVQHATAEARHLLLCTAREKLNAPMEKLVLKDGTITDPDTGNSVTYWKLKGGEPFNAKVQGEGKLKFPETYRIVSRSSGRLDILEKVTGGACFVQDLDLPDMVHGRVVRPPNYAARLVSVDDKSIRRMPGVLDVVLDGSFLAVITEREEQAIAAMEALKKAAVWENNPDFSDYDMLWEDLLNHADQQEFLIVDGTPGHDPIPPIKAPEDAVQTLSAAYYRPYHMHASIGPSAAVAQLVDGKMTVWSHTQGPHPLRRDIAQVLGMQNDDVRVIHMDGAGCYGHNGADDAGLDAALLARAIPGRPVSLKWMRKDENSWEPYGTAMVIESQGSLNRDGAVIDWNHDVWGYSPTGRARPSQEISVLMPAWHLEESLKPPPAMPSMVYHGGIHRNADPFYTFPRKRIVKHFVPDSPLRTGALRSLGSYANVFAIESFMDELAHAAGIDPVEFRLNHLEDERAQAVIKATAKKAGWKTTVNSSESCQGQGFAFARYKNIQSYVAVVVTVIVNKDSGNIRLERAVLGADVGQVVNSDAVRSQLEGVFVQAASWTLKEQVRFDDEGISSVDWYSYPILRFRDAPQIETVLINRPGRPYRGVGEGAQGPVPAAIANAIFDAVGIRLRKIPFTPDRVKKALK